MGVLARVVSTEIDRGGRYCMVLDSVRLVRSVSSVGFVRIGAIRRGEEDGKWRGESWRSREVRAGEVER